MAEKKKKIEKSEVVIKKPETLDELWVLVEPMLKHFLSRGRRRTEFDVRLQSLEAREEKRNERGTTELGDVGGGRRTASEGAADTGN